MIERREFITLLGGAMVAGPVAARAQEPAMPVVGYLNSGSAGPNVEGVEAFRRGLAESGYVEGRRHRALLRCAQGQPASAHSPALANVSSSCTLETVFGLSGLTRKLIAVAWGRSWRSNSRRLPSNSLLI